MNSKLFLYLILALASGALWAADAAHIVFTAGQAKVGARAAQVGDTVREGQLLSTGSDGYLYLETLDKGFFILRPNSAGQIVAYQIDAVNPANSRIKLELQSGVARHISGEAVKKSRDNFRFNTPVAAVGVRGTDFTVFADQDKTRIAVLSGGVVVSPLTGLCVAAGFGPCDGPASRELFASAAGQVLQVNRGQVPMILQGMEQSPDVTAPPRSDEPAASKQGSRSVPATNATVAPTSLGLDTFKASLLERQLTLQAVITPVPSPTPISATPVNIVPAVPPAINIIPVGPPSLIWGRWQALLDQTVEVDVAALRAKNQLIATNNYYALLRSNDIPWQRPVQNNLGFSLQQSQAAILDESSRQVTLAKIENGQLQIDFARASFLTKFDLVNQSERFQLQSSGEVGSDGKLFGGNPFLRPNNMNVSGALSHDNSTAAYLFQSRLDDRRIATGVTAWGK
jgi:hypothetical protein